MVSISILIESDANESLGAIKVFEDCISLIEKEGTNP